MDQTTKTGILEDLTDISHIYHPNEILINLVLSFILGVLISLIYKKTHKGLSYSQAQGGAQRYWGVHGGGHGAQGNWGHGGDGPANQGGGGGGAGYAGSQGGKGGSGVVVMRYKIG